MAAWGLTSRLFGTEVLALFLTFFVAFLPQSPILDRYVIPVSERLIFVYFWLVVGDSHVAFGA